MTIEDINSTDEELRQRVRELAEELDTVRGILVEFKKKVVAEAHLIRQEQGWCYNGMREHLNNLGLEPNPRCYNGGIDVHFTFENVELPEDGIGTTIMDRIKYAFDGIRWSGEGVGDITGTTFDESSLYYDESGA